MLTHALVGDEGRTIELGWQGGRRTRFHAMWLRDNALDDKTRSAGNGQRLITILDIPAETRIGAAGIKDGALEVSFVPEGKTVSFPAQWLSANAYDRDELREPGWTGDIVQRWTKATMQNSVPRARYAAATSCSNGIAPPFTDTSPLANSTASAVPPSCFAASVASLSRMVRAAASAALPFRSLPVEAAVAEVLAIFDVSVAVTRTRESGRARRPLADRID